MTLCPSPALAWEAHPGDEALTRPLRWALPTTCTDVTETIPDEDDILWLGLGAAAIDVMDRITHRRFGGPCRYEVRPCITDCQGCNRRSCSCRWEKINLQRMLPRPLRGIVQISVGCCEIPLTDWRIDNERYLVPIQGGELSPWPRQNLNRNPGDDGTWWIEAVAGREPPQMVLQATADLRWQLYGLCQGRACDVPSNAVSITREGVTVSLEAGLIRQLPLAATIQDLYKNRPRPQRIWSASGPEAAVRLSAGDGLSLEGVDEIVISDTPPIDTTVVWIDTSGGS